MSKPDSSRVDTSTSRRGFLATSGAAIAAGALATQARRAQAAEAFGENTIKVALVGAGGRGTGAVEQIFNTPGPVKLVAIADAFQHRLDGSLRHLSRRAERRDDATVDVPDDRKFVGLDAYQKVMETDCDLVVLATPPGFRPVQFEAAVDAGKHVFMEKPVAVDAPGIRRVLAAGEKAEKNGTAVAVGIQRRHEPRYIETVKRLHDGAIGDIVLTRVYWNGTSPWVRNKLNLSRNLGHDPNELEYQVDNWYYFNWVCGDHIVEQHIHNIDVGNWVHNATPIQAQGMGGRQVRTGRQFGQIFDHHMVEFTMPGGHKMLSCCRHMDGCWGEVAEYAHGTKGTANVSAGRIMGPDGDVIWRYRGRDAQGHQQEQTDLIANLRKGVIQNEAEYGATSTMTAIMGRMATYGGKVVKWEEVINSDLSLADDLASWEAKAPVQPDEDGRYPVPVPGETPVV